MHETGTQSWCTGTNPAGWDGQGGERGVQDGGHMYTHVNLWQKPLQYCKIISFQLKQIN